ncbi:MAG: metal-dependent transcriptional regulator [Desulfobacterales bacterium]|nr:metal-dependent transcriptional regulator [Desulfobacterales bacterium]MDJ0876460.1 metal-dependent transcriptional regulator [Desulfobacterales bacterium]
MDLNLTPSQENYLEHIWHLADKGSVRVVDLAEAVGVKRPSVTRAVNNLAALGLVRHEQYGTIDFTSKGYSAARYIAQRDARLKRFLMEVLLLNPQKADKEVCRIEHAIGDEVLRRLDVLVDFVKSNKSVRKKLDQEFRSNQLTNKQGKYAIGAKLHV